MNYYSILSWMLWLWVTTMMTVTDTSCQLLWIESKYAYNMLSHNMRTFPAYTWIHYNFVFYYFTIIFTAAIQPYFYYCLLFYVDGIGLGSRGRSYSHSQYAQGSGSPGEDDCSGIYTYNISTIRYFYIHNLEAIYVIYWSWRV